MASEANPFGDEILDGDEVGEDEEPGFRCQTQRGFMPTFAQPYFPPQKKSGFHGDGLMVGYKDLIPRWDISAPLKLLYYTQIESFPNQDDRRYTEACFASAAAEWNALSLGLTILQTADPSAAHFNLRYARNDINTQDTFATSFFPHEPTDVVVYNYSFDFPGNRKILKEVMLHEIGHILGLRHEFAKTKPAELEIASSQFMAMNPKSVMSYTSPPAIQQSDIDGVKAFYKLPKWTDIDGLKVTDYPAISKQQKQQKQK